LCCIAARRKYSIELGAPWGSISVEKNMPSIKFYHDLDAGRNSKIDWRRYRRNSELKNFRKVLGTIFLIMNRQCMCDELLSHTQTLLCLLIFSNDDCLGATLKTDRQTDTHLLKLSVAYTRLSDKTSTIAVRNCGPCHNS